MRNYDSRKLTCEFVTYQDMFIGDKVVNRSELCKNLGITSKKLRSIGGYEYFLEKFELTRPSVYHYENVKKVDMLEEFILNFIVINGRNPLKKEIECEIGVSQSFINKNLKGIKRFMGSIGVEHCKYITNSNSFNLSKSFMIDEFCNVYSTPPTVRQLMEDSRKISFSIYTIISVFGSYKNFLVECNMPINGYLGSPDLALDGHICDSKSELQIDDFLSRNEIEHSTHIKYKEFTNDKKSRFICDFMLKDGCVVEYFGLVGFKSYDQKVEAKLKLLEECGMKYIEIYPSDLKNLKEVFKDYLPIERGCEL